MTRAVPLARSLLAVASFPGSVLSAQWAEPHVHVLLDVTKGAVGDLFGWTAVGIGDVNGDGVTDIAVSAPFDDIGFASSAGKVYAISGSDGATLWSRAESLTSSILGYAMEVADWNADGALDVLAAAPFNDTGGRVWIYSGLDGSTLGTLDPPGAADEGFGSSIAAGGDFDGDGTEDLAVGAIGVDTTAGAGSGRVFVYRRGTTVPFTSIDGPAANAEFGLGLAFLGDVSVPSDGRDELVVGHRLASFFDGEARVYSHDGALVSELYSVSGVGMGFNLIGDRIDGGKDVDLDGLPDFLVGDMAADEVQVFSGIDGSLLHTLDGSGEGGDFTPGHLIDDVDGDGHADLALGAWVNDAGASNGGKVFVYSGASGALLKTMTATVDDRRLGIEVRPVGDHDGDGRLDLLVGAYGGGNPGPPAGRAYILSGHLPAPPNTICPGELPGDPLLADTGGDPTAGPLPGSSFETFNLSLDCSGSSAPGPYFIAGRLQKRAVPLPSSFGHLWTSGIHLFSFTGMHASDVVEAVPGGLVLPDSIALIGLVYTAQGFCGGPDLRASNAITQTLGE